MRDGDREVMQQAWATLDIKAVSEDAREFEGWASTPVVDMGLDSMDPFGAEFKLPMPLLWEHAKKDIKDPVGWITHAKASAQGIWVKGKFAKVDFPASLKDQVDRAWSLVKSGLVRGLSIGWRRIKGEPIKGTNAIRWTKWRWHELSAVAIGMNEEATIQSVKSAAVAPGRAVSPSPGASGKSPNQRSNAMNGINELLTEKVTAFDEKSARMKALSEKCEGNFDKLTADEQSEYDGLNGEVEKLGVDITRLRGAQRAASGAKAIPSSAGTDPAAASRVRNGDFRMKGDGGNELKPGTLWTRALLARAWAIKHHGAMSDAAAYAKHAWPDSPDLHAYLGMNPALLEMQYKANPATGASGNWAEVLNAANTIENEFIDVLMPATIIGKLGMRPAAFNTKMLRRTSGSTTAAWVGKAAAKPVGENVWDTVSVDQSKIADMIVLTDDQVMTSHIDSVEATRTDLVEQIQQFADEQFCSSTLAAVAGTNPAGILFGVNDIASNGATADDLYADLYALDNRFNAANIGIDQVVLIMSSFLASGISKLRTSLGVKAFDGFTARGGDLDGKRVIISNNVGGSSSGSNLIAVAPREILFAQNGGVRVDMSREATIDMAGGNSPTYSLFQKNSMAVRVEWWVSWSKARSAAAQYVSGAAYAPQPAA